MPAVTFNLYDLFRKKQASGSGVVNLTSLTVKAMVVTAGYTLNQNTHAFRSDLGANEVSGTGYAAGGNTLANPVVSMDGAGNVTVDFDDPTLWSQNAAGFTNGRRFVIYIARGGLASADELIGFSNDFGADKGNVDGDFSMQVNASGLFTSPR
jgi:hypothetical protein